jgi:hypothetical protein
MCMQPQFNMDALRDVWIAGWGLTDGDFENNVIMSCVG